MPTQTVVVPFRGTAELDLSGTIRATPGSVIEPVDLAIIFDKHIEWTGRKPGFRTYAHDYDFETGTVEVDLTCDDETYLATIAEFMTKIDLRQAEAHAAEEMEREQIENERAGKSINEKGDFDPAHPIDEAEEEKRVATARAKTQQGFGITKRAREELKRLPYRGDRAILP